MFAILPYFLLAHTCRLQHTDNNPAQKKEDIAQAINKIDPTASGFDKEIKPILIKNCSRRHFPGGKMYEKLPFDKDTTIINHGATILKRIKNKEENTSITNFLPQKKWLARKQAI